MHELATIPFSRTSATDWSAISHERLRISERALQGAVLVKLSRRVDVDAALRSVIGNRPPAPGTWIANAETQWLWQGPREWLLISQAVPGSALTERIATGLAGTTAIAREITDKLLVLDIAGTASERLFSKGTSLDRALVPPSACWRTRFANLPSTVVRGTSPPDFTLITDRSTAVYLHQWIARAAADPAT